MLQRNPVEPSSSGLALDMKALEEEQDRCPDFKILVGKLKHPHEGDQVQMKLDGGKFQVVKDRNLEIYERKTKARLSEYNLIHRNLIRLICVANPLLFVRNRHDPIILSYSGTQ